MPKSRVVSFICPDTTYTKLLSKSDRTGKTVSRLVREAVLQEYPEEDEGHA